MISIERDLLLQCQDAEQDRLAHLAEGDLEWASMVRLKLGLHLVNALATWTADLLG